MEKRGGKNHSMYKPELHRVEMVKCACGCGKIMNKYGSRGHPRKYIQNHYIKILGRKNLGKKMSQETKDKVSKAKRGVLLKRPEDCIRSISYNERRRFQRDVQKKVFERDDYICQICNNRGGSLQVDHIQRWADYPELRFEMDNCRTVCMSCHYFLTFKRKMPKGLVWGHNFSARKNI